MKQNLYVIAGPTASGKTAIAIELAKLTNGEVVSADSMQVYIGMDIGTAKPTQAEMDGIPHHLLSIISPAEPFSVAEYQRLAQKAIADIFSRNKTPILAGGTGFYINAVLYNTAFAPIENEEEKVIREKFAAIAQENGAEYLHEKLKQTDPEAAIGIHPHNIKRVARALSYYETTGSLFSAHNKAERVRRQNSALQNDKIICHTLQLPRQTLYNHINARAHTMWEAGLIDETRNLLSKGYDLGLASMGGIGYKETIKYLNARLTETEAIAAIQQATRHYAKRQETWFRHQSPDAKPVSAEGKTAKEIAEEIFRGALI